MMAAPSGLMRLSLKASPRRGSLATARRLAGCGAGPCARHGPQANVYEAIFSAFKDIHSVNVFLPPDVPSLYYLARAIQGLGILPSADHQPCFRVAGECVQ
jgi:hypothetical protein